jgi:hypothetical protein
MFKSTLLFLLTVLFISKINQTLAVEYDDDDDDDYYRDVNGIEKISTKIGFVDDLSIGLTDEKDILVLDDVRKF